MAARAITGWGGTLTIGGAAIPVRNVTITRQASEFNLTAHGDGRLFSGAGRVQRGGSCEAYVNAAVETAVASVIESPNLASPVQLVFTGAGAGSVTMFVIITGADQTHSSEDAAIYSINFTETLALA
jgi:hypothetical protein